MAVSYFKQVTFNNNLNINDPFEIVFLFGQVKYESGSTTRPQIAMSRLTFQWRVKGTTTWKQIIPDDQNNYLTKLGDAYDYFGVLSYKYQLVIPAFTFPVGLFEFRLYGYSDDVSTTSVYEGEATILTPVPDVEISYPNGVFVNGTSSIIFSWSYSDVSSSAQQKYEIGWRQEGDWNTVLVNSSRNAHTFDANTFPVGIIEWRLRAFNSYGLANAYVYGSFTCIGQSEAVSNLTVKNAALTEIKWEYNENFNVMQIKIIRSNDTVFYSGDIPGTGITSYKPDLFLDDGEYVVMIRVQNEFGLWSNWSSKVFTIVTVKPEKPNIFVAKLNYGAMITVNMTATHGVLYRRQESEEAKRIAIMNGTSYFDFMLMPGIRYEYFLRVFNDSGYTDSEIKEICLNYSGAIVGNVENPSSQIHLHMSESELCISKDFVHERNTSLIHYVGREYPVREIGEQKNLNVTMNIFLNKKDYKLLHEIFLMDSVLYFVCAELFMFCDLSRFDSTNTLFDRGFNVSLTFKKISYDNEVKVNV